MISPSPRAHQLGPTASIGSGAYSVIVVKIKYSNARCGAGKTHWACKMMGGTVGRYVLAIDRKAVGEERQAMILEFAAKAGLQKPEVITLFSPDDPNSVRGESVARSITKAAERYGSLEHVVIIITHAGMKLADLSGFAGWTLVVDEVPKLVECETRVTGAMASWLEANYHLTPTPDGSLVSFKGTFTPGDISVPSSNYFLNFHQRVLLGDTYCSLSSWWEDGSWAYWRIWPVVSLTAFAEVYVLGDSFADTETGLILQRTTGIELEEIEEIKALDNQRVWRQRPVIIRYFAEDHEAGSTLWSKPQFAGELKKIGDWIAANSQNAGNHLWTCNDSIAPILRKCGIRGLKVQPQQAGTNGLTDYTVATMVYTAKPSPQEALLYARWGIGPEKITASRERSTLRQFAMRTALRLPDDQRPLEFCVYDEAQADDLRSYILEQYGIAADLVFEDVEVARPSPTRVKVVAKAPKTNDEIRRDARERQQRCRHRKLMIAA